MTIDPEKSRDCSFKNPGILADLKSRDPGIPGIPLGPGDDYRPSTRVTLDFKCVQNLQVCTDVWWQGHEGEGQEKKRMAAKQQSNPVYLDRLLKSVLRINSDNM